MTLLERRRAVILEDLKLKVEVEDWHGVADASMDLREIDAVLAYQRRPATAAVTVANRPDVSMNTPLSKLPWRVEPARVEPTTSTPMTIPTFGD